MAVIIFTVKTNANVIWLYCRGSGGGPIRIALTNGVGRHDLPAGSDQVAELTFHASLNKTGDFTIEQETASGNIVLAERLGIVVTDPNEFTVKVPFKVADAACP